jgi:hypothetical protein
MRRFIPHLDNAPAASQIYAALQHNPLTEWLWAAAAVNHELRSA